MNIQESGIVLLAWLSLATTACFIKDSPSEVNAVNSATGAPTARPTKVLTGVSQSEGIDWLLIDPATGAAEPLGHSAPGGELLVVDDAPGEYYFRDEAFIWKDSWRVPAAVAQKIAPWPPISGITHAVWLDEQAGAPRLLEMREPTAAETNGMSAEPPDARPYWAVLWGFDDGAWREIERRATSWGADGTLGPAAMDDLRRERGRSARAIDDAASCAGNLCSESPPGPPEGFKGQAPEDWRVAVVTGGRLWLGVALGDKWHPVGPLLLEKPRATPQVLPASTGAPLRLQVQGAQLLVSPETPPGAVYVIDLTTASRRDLTDTGTLPAWVK